MNDVIKFKNSISAAEFCELRESVGFQKLTTEQAETVLSNTTFTINNADTGFFIILYRRLLFT